MSENLSAELPVITSIDDLPESAIEELTNGEGSVVDVKPVVKAAVKPEQHEISTNEEPSVVEEDTPIAVEPEVVKPKRKRRTKAEMEAARAAEAEK